MTGSVGFRLARTAAGAGMWMVLAAGASAQSASQPSTAAGATWLRVRGERVNLRARPDRNSVIVAVVTEGDVLECVGGEYGWRAVVPPEGVFSYVASEFVEVDESGVGRVKVEAGKLRVRVGSRVTELDPLKSDVQTWLANGAAVRVLARGGPWLRIEPPEDVALYVSDAYVTELSAEESRGRVSRRGGSTATSGPAGARRGVRMAGEWGRRLDEAEAAIEAELEREVLERDWEGHAARMRELSAQREDAAVARLAAVWVERLEEQAAEQGVLRRAAQAMERSAAARGGTSPASRGAEYDARGVLLPSVAGAATRFRLVDPLTRRLVAYVELGQAARRGEALLRRYVGVRGRRIPDPAAGADVIEAEAIEVMPVGATTQSVTQRGG